ncbi:MAG: desulfoferrodoxin FeS4 iron-binding domain-containing protein [Candidatus Bathyarchaeota archaeon]
MTEVGETYLCEICGNKVKILESGAGTLICCGQPMTKISD